MDDYKVIKMSYISLLKFILKIYNLDNICKVEKDLEVTFTVDGLRLTNSLLYFTY